MTKYSFLICLLCVSLSIATEGAGYGTFISGPRGVLLALHEIGEADTVTLLQGVGYVELKVPSKEGSYSKVLRGIPQGVPIDSISLVIEKGLSLKIHSVSLSADSLRITKKNGKAMLLLGKDAVEKFQFDFNSEAPSVLEPKEPVLNTIAQYGRDGLVFIELQGKDLSESIVSTGVGRVSINAEVTFMKRYLPLLGGYAAKIDSDGFSISYDSAKARYVMKSVVENTLTLTFVDTRELEVPQLSFWKSSKDKGVVSLPDIEVAEVVADLSDEKREERELASVVEESVFETFPLYVMKEDVNVRENPSTSAEVVATLPKGTVITAAGENSAWFKVVLPEGEEAWVYKSLVKKEGELTSQEAASFFDGSNETASISDVATESNNKELFNSNTPLPEERVAFLIKDNINIRNIPKVGEDNSVIGVFGKGTRLVVIDQKNNWDHVRLESGDLGWVYSKFVLDSSRITPEMWDSFYNSGKAKSGLTVEIAENDSLKSSDQTFDIGSKPDVFKVTAEEETTKKRNKASTVDTTKVAEEKKPEQVAVSYKKYGRDPFLPLDVKNLAKPSMPKVDDLTLIGVIYSNAAGAQNFALFEEKLKSGTTTFSLKEGEAIEDGKLLHIEENRVVFLMREADFTYTVEKIMENIDE